MKSFRQYLRQTLYESDPQKYDDVGKKIDNETSEVPVWRGGIPPSEIVDKEALEGQVWQTDEELEKDEEQQAKNREEKLAKRWVKRYNEKLMAQQQEREMQPLSHSGYPSMILGGWRTPMIVWARAGALAPVPPDEETKETKYHSSDDEQRASDERHAQWVHKENHKEIWNRSQNRGVQFLPDPERVRRQQEWDDMRARQREYDPEADAHRDGASRGG